MLGTIMTVTVGIPLARSFVLAGAIIVTTALRVILSMMNKTFALPIGRNCLCRPMRTSGDICDDGHDDDDHTTIQL